MSIVRRVAVGGVMLLILFSGTRNVALAGVSSEPPSAEEIVAGQVMDAVSMRPLIGAQVIVVETGQETLTDGAGRFRFTNVPGEQVTLRVVMVGYGTLTETVRTGRTDIRLVVEQEAIGLDAIVVTGVAGETQVRAIGNVVTSVPVAEVIERRMTNDLQTFLPAEVPGLSVRSGGGQIGVGGTINIRGATSLSLSNQPLIFVDGVRVDNRTSALAANFPGGRANPSRLNDLDLSEIESIEVIKGPAAATLYGTEASNGVIQIITKRGQTGAPRFEVSVTGGTNSLWNDEQKYPLVWGRDPETGQVVSANLVRLERERGTPIFRTGYPRSTSASVSGGTGSLSYFFAADIGKDEGIVSYQWQDKFSGRTNLSYTSDRFEAGVNMGVVRQKTSNAAAQQAMPFQIMWGSPEKLNTRSRGLFVNAHEDYNLLSGVEEVDRVTGGFFASFQQSSWLRHRLNVGGDFGNARSWALWPRTAEQPGPFPNNIGRKDVLSDRTGYTTLNYTVVAPIHLTPNLTSETSGGAQYYQNQTQITTATGVEFPVPGVSTVSAAAQQMSSEDFLENKTLGVFLQQMFGWHNRRFVTLAVRADDNSAFGKDFNVVTYPKASATWVLSEEPFWDVSVINTLKLRAAWGRAGQQPDIFAATQLYAPTTGPGGVPTLTPSNIGNPDLRPEVGEELEVGFDASVLNNRIALDFTYYWQNRRDAIVPKAALPSFGFPGTEFVNVGRVSNRGMEVSIGTQIVRQTNLGWDLGFKFSTYTNRIEDLGGIVPPVVGHSWPGQRHVEGFPVASLFMKKVVHAEFGPDGELINVLCEGGDPITGGGPAVPCDEAGTAFWGQPTPAWDFGAHTSVRWRDFQLSATADAVGGYVKCNGDIGWAHAFFRNTKVTVERSDPIHAAYDAMGAICQFGLVDAGFAKLRDVSLRYELPGGILNHIGASSASVTVSAHNLATLWQAQKHSFGTPVIDPEIHSNDNPLGVGDMNAYVQDQWPMTQRINITIRTLF